MSSENNKEWLKEYESFLNADKDVPPGVSAAVSKRMEPLLDPSPFRVFAKLLGIHSVVGFFSLSFCHQFELNPFRTSHSLDNWFMSIGGHSVCMIVCGVLFLGLTVVASSYFLSLEEARALRRTGFPQSFALGMLSLILFHTIGAELALTIGALWLFGALIGGFIATEAVWKVKYARIQRLQRV